MKKPTTQQLSKADIKRACDILRRDDGVGAGNYVEQLSWLLFLRIFENVEAQFKELLEAEGQKAQTIVEKEYQWSAWAKKDWKDKDELIFFINQKLFPYLRGLKGTKEREKVSELFRELDGNKIRSAYTLLDVIGILDKVEMVHYQDTHLLSQVYEEILQEMGSEGGWAGEFYTPRPVVRLMVQILNPQLGESILDPFVGSAGFLVEAFRNLEENLKKKSKLGVKEWRILQTKTFYGQEKKPLPFLIGTMNMMLHRILVPNLIRANTLMEDVHNVPESQKVDIIITNPPFGGQEHQTVQNNFPIPVASTEALALQYVMRRLKNGGRCGIVLPEGQVLFGGGTFQKIREELLQKFNVHSIISLPKGVFASMGAGVKTNLVFFDKTGSTKKIWFGEIYGKYTKKQIIKDADLEDVLKKWKKREVSESTWVTSMEDIAKRNFDLSPKNPNKTKDDELPEPKELLGRIRESQKEVEQILRNIDEII
ncbi:MAG: N-6 DNA methylase [Candidatus Brennerbacteria bacterium RIFOXYD1_FULL_41_16]|uniref:site-specific DNA-methyltransferase (adenine-specific) n=1 Tax=Candidatus Brennerbacteria bacterium RIFOXYD1_FULL_41_16 TaxID=1797529 RepID=A0A1G1XME4_9BACT|nr:MAG: N-6 DNA methylase [Candidatus Brennerbacteria bacterium RIFOXYD1_FULL_41_16]